MITRNFSEGIAIRSQDRKRCATEMARCLEGTRGVTGIREGLGLAVTIETPWGPTVELRKRRLHPGSDTPRSEVVRIAKGRSYCEWALAHPQLYRLMFGLTGGELRQHGGLEVAVAGAVANTPQAQAALDVLVGSMARVTGSERIDSTDPVGPAGQFLSATHGWVLLEIGGAFGAEGGGLDIIRELAVNLMVGLGDSREAASASLRSAEASRPAGA
jgi:Tetracyclin repressor-like, C-terminal domain